MKILLGVMIVAILTATNGRASELILSSKTQALEFVEPLQNNCLGKDSVFEFLKKCQSSGRHLSQCRTDITSSELRDSYTDTNEEVIAQYLPAKPALEAASGFARDLLEEVVTDLPIPALGGVIDDFNTRLLPALLQASDQLAEPQTLGLSWNLPELFDLKMRLGAYANPQVELNPALESALIERAQLGQFRSKERSLSERDDYALNLDLTVVGQWIGRDIGDHAYAHSRISRTVIAGKDLEGGDFESRVYLNVARVLMKGAPDDSQLGAASCALDLYNRVSREDFRRLENSSLDKFWSLVHNQPQLTFSARQVRRDALIGADIESYRVKFSSGLFNNINFLKWTGACDRELGGHGCGRAYQKMANGFASRYGLGLAAYYEWGSLADVSVPLPSLVDDTLQPLLPPLVNDRLADNDEVFHLEGGEYRRYGWNLGAMLKAEMTSNGVLKDSLRIDGGMDYYRYDHDPVRVDHEVARLTITYKRGDFSIPFHLMYRAKTEFEADLGDDLVFGVGLQSSFRQW